MKSKSPIERYLEAAKLTDSPILRMAYQKEQILQELFKEKRIFTADVNQAIQEIEKLKKAIESLKKGDF